MNAETRIRETNNLRIWNEVSRTDPRHTKKVNQRGGFTAISAHYQVMSATSAFGPIGIGWGYMASDPIVLDGIVTVGVTIWHGDRNNFYGPVWGGADLRDSKGKLDSDAVKKAGTDGLTKALSQLGFNADVFLGRFDDNKYIEEVRQEFEEADREAAESAPVKVPGISKIKERLNKLMLVGNADITLEKFNALVHDNAADLATIRDARHDYWTGDPDYQEGSAGHEGFKRWIVRRRAELATSGQESVQFQLLMSTLAEVETKKALADWLAKNMAVIDELDGAESRAFEDAYNAKESGIHAMDTVSA